MNYTYPGITVDDFQDGEEVIYIQHEGAPAVIPCIRMGMRSVMAYGPPNAGVDLPIALDEREQRRIDSILAIEGAPKPAEGWRSHRSGRLRGYRKVGGPLRQVRVQVNASDLVVNLNRGSVVNGIQPAESEHPQDLLLWRRADDLTTGAWGHTPRDPSSSPSRIHEYAWHYLRRLDPVANHADYRYSWVRNYVQSGRITVLDEPTSETGPAAGVEVIDPERAEMRVRLTSPVGSIPAGVVVNASRGVELADGYTLLWRRSSDTSTGAWGDRPTASDDGSRTDMPMFYILQADPNATQDAYYYKWIGPANRRLIEVAPDAESGVAIDSADSGLSEAHASDLAIITEVLQREALSRQWCSEYDEIVSEINARITGNLGQRMASVSVEVVRPTTTTVSVEVPQHVRREGGRVLRNYLEEHGLVDGEIIQVHR